MSRRPAPAIYVTVPCTHEYPDGAPCRQWARDLGTRIAVVRT